MLQRLNPYWRASARTIAFGALLLIVSAGFELLQPWPVKWLVDSVFLKHPGPAWMNWLGPLDTAEDKSLAVLMVCLAILVLALLHKGTNLGSQFLLIRAGSRTVERLRSHVCRRLLQLSLSYHDRNKVGESLYRIAYDTPAAQTLLMGAVVPMASGVILLLGITIVMWRIDPLLTAVSLATTPVFWLLIKGFGRTVERRSKAYHQRETTLVSFMQEALTSIRAIQAYTREPDTAQEFEVRAAQSVAANSRLTWAQLAFSSGVGVAMALGTAAVVWFGAHRVLEGDLTLGDVLVFLAYLGMLYQPMNAFSHGSSVAQSANSQLARVFEILDVQPEIASQPGALRPESVAGRLELRDVSFQYDADRPVLGHVNLAIEPGQAIALVGRTGAGKSTLANLLVRFYDPSAGAVLLDGRDIRELDLDWVRRQVAVVLQDPIILSATIGENIAFGGAEATREQIETAARQAQLDEFISSLPDGYETELGERGVNLSGGQRQRLAIARAFVKDAPILVLDEPTSSLDSQTEEALLEALRALMRGRTTIIIAHRLSTVRMTDRIFVLNDGRIVEEGCHSDLISGDTLYRKLYLIQQQAGGQGSALAPELADESPQGVTNGQHGIAKVVVPG
jgi:ATP-binding cassette subfamily B protein